ncbi:hypothetical protein H5407_17615 [Mitsuaria sp. WAJ17]|uniref:hypothetical protein n=1 Tax=Mitsuaria sp. WAJ17 TaxID=2761452 RepID=UPI001601BB11|nr:hypothetical protein [Mitsuaria sp. WAJ17]MBB2487051.1 hypothetical protein [Mitsuaria sp. WAJ17]
MTAPEPPRAAALAAGFSALQQRFRQGLADRAARLEAAQGVAEQAALLHQLAGAAGGYLMSDLEAAARDALACCEATVPEGKRRQALQAVLARLRGLALPPRA